MVVVNGVAGVVVLVVSCALSAGSLMLITKGLLRTMKRRSRE